MTQTTAFVIRYFVLLLALGLGCATGSAPLGDAATAQRDRHASAPASAGELVYDGTVYELDADPSAAPLFAYQRRVRDLGDVREATHVTRAPAGVLLSISSTHTADYALVEHEQIDRQTGIVGHARMLDAHHVELERTRGDRVRRRVETVDAPVVTGATLFGWTIAHWDELASGRVLPVRFVAVDDVRTYAFELALVETDATTTVISMRAKQAIVRAAVPPMRLVFDTATRKVLRYEGRVPPKVAKGHALRPLDARVEYAYASATYR
jgi:hypothetical protein